MGGMRKPFDVSECPRIRKRSYKFAGQHHIVRYEDTRESKQQTVSRLLRCAQSGADAVQTSHPHAAIAPDQDIAGAPLVMPDEVQPRRVHR